MKLTGTISMVSYLVIAVSLLGCDPQPSTTGEGQSQGGGGLVGGDNAGLSSPTMGADSGDISANAASCEDLIQCLNTCGSTDEACQNACYSMSSSTAQSALNALLECDDVCAGDQTCMQSSCPEALSACLDVNPDATSTAPPQHQEGQAGLCASGIYEGDLQGISATARLTLEVLTTTSYVAGDIESPTAYYTFHGEMPGIDFYTGLPTSNVAFVEVIEWGTGERFRAELNLFADHFVLISNIYEGLHTTTYTFRCRT